MDDDNGASNLSENSDVEDMSIKGGDLSISLVQATALSRHQVEEEEIDQIISETQAMYAQGIPLFTKKALRQVAEAFDNILRGTSPDKIVRIVALNGFQWEFQLDVGDAYDDGQADSPDVERFLAKPCPDYQSIENLTNKFYITYVAAFLPISICHEIKSRNKATGETLLPRSIATRAEAEEGLRRTRAGWQAGKHFPQLQALLEKHDDVLPRTVRKVVAFACCAIAHHEDYVGRYMHQHALALHIRDFFAARQGNTQRISCYAQDPVYTPVDEEVLRAFDVQVVDDPRGFLEVDETSVVISISPNIPVRQIVADIARPALMIWDSVPDTAPAHTSTDTPALRVREMIQSDYVDIGFPGEEGVPPEKQNFGELSIYVRKENKAPERRPSML